MPTQKSGACCLICQQQFMVKFSTLFIAKDVDFLHFSGVSCQKRIKMNIECMRMALPVVISKLLNRFYDKPCTGVEA